ncbi:unnamed protein product [Psylliodes chrysocephalus]|uniref:Uridine diphosphate glucose pyrophosphatase NUDT14 n=1 Tax=Psylliodes chrysocephalus TaxID=3402493 RepID=A0A9P0CQZ4_9CUCU|nr:unnamed protein product [Psylliodes chrysocephala]
MDDISEVIFQPIERSRWMKLYTMQFVQNGRNRTWHIAARKDSVAIILYNKTRNVLLFVRQFRPAVYFASIPESDQKIGQEIDIKKYPPKLGITLELCAGLVDKDKSLEEIAKEEIFEECGYDVPLNSLEKIGSYRCGTGTNSGVQTDFYCEVTDDMKISVGGGIDNELIEVVEMTVDDVKKYLNQSYLNSPPGFIYCMHWFLYNKVECLCL